MGNYAKMRWDDDDYKDAKRKKKGNRRNRQQRREEKAVADLRGNNYAATDYADENMNRGEVG